MRLQNLYIILFTLVTYFPLLGQQLFTHTSNQDFFQFFNPAAMNNFYLLLEQDENQLSIFVRQQEISDNDIDGKPFTAGGIGNWWWKNKFINSGVGFISDQAGAIGVHQLYSRIAVDLTGFRKKEKKRHHSLFFGTGIHTNFFRINRTKIDELYWDDPLLVANEDITKDFSVRTSMGLYGHKSFDKWQITLFGGVSFHQLNITGRNEFELSKTFKHYFINGGIIKRFSLESGNQVFWEVSTLKQRIENLRPRYWYYPIFTRLHIDFNKKTDFILTTGIGFLENSIQVESMLYFTKKWSGGVVFDFWYKDTIYRSAPAIEFRFAYYISSKW